MRKLILPLAAAGTALAVATPAAAQYYPQPQPYNYQVPQYGYGAPQYDYRGQRYGLQMQVDALQRRIEDLRRARVLRGDHAERLRREARSIERRIRQTSGFGIGALATGDLQMRLARLEQQVNFAASRGRYGGYGYNNGYGYNGQGYGGYNNGYGQYGYGDRDHDDGGRYDRDDDDD